MWYLSHLPIHFMPTFRSLWMQQSCIAILRWGIPNYLGLVDNVEIWKCYGYYQEKATMVCITKSPSTCVPEGKLMKLFYYSTHSLWLLRKFCRPQLHVYVCLSEHTSKEKTATIQHVFLKTVSWICMGFRDFCLK